MIDSLNIVYGYLHVRIKLLSASETCDPSCKNFSWWFLEHGVIGSIFKNSPLDEMPIQFTLQHFFKFS